MSTLTIDIECRNLAHHVRDSAELEGSGWLCIFQLQPDGTAAAAGRGGLLEMLRQRLTLDQRSMDVHPAWIVMLRLLLMLLRF